MSRISREQFIAAFGDGSALGVEISWSLEREPLEAAGGIATALPLLPEGPALIVSGDIYTAFDYATLRSRAEAMAEAASAPRVHLVMVRNPDYHPTRRFRAGRRADRRRGRGTKNVCEHRLVRHGALPRRAA